MAMNGMQKSSTESEQQNGRIQPLAQDIVHLMAAGEVIDSLCAVVRELVENALDADATRVSVSLWPSRWQVRVADNGCGMDLANLQQAAVAHATSKISTRPDLLNIRSLGFRGEALHSIAQLAQLEIRSRTATAGALGYQVHYDAVGLPQRVVEVAIAPGTSAGDLATRKGRFALVFAMAWTNGQDTHSSNSKECL